MGPGNAHPLPFKTGAYLASVLTLSDPPTGRASVDIGPAQIAELKEDISMRLTFGHLGDWIVDPSELADRLGVSTSYLKHLNHQGQVEARIKAGEGEAAGLTRVTVRLYDKGWRGLFDCNGELISEERW